MRCHRIYKEDTKGIETQMEDNTGCGRLGKRCEIEKTQETAKARADRDFGRQEKDS